MRNWPDTLSAWREKKQDPDAYAINLVKHKEVFRKLMEHAISLIVVDEAAQLAENLSLVVHIHRRYPTTPAHRLRDRCRWYFMCKNCCQPGHIAIECKFKPKCVRCDGESHATRNCPRVDEDAISTSVSEPITADDGIQRDVLNPPRVNFSDSKRSKKNSTTREEAFAKPDKHKDAMRKAFRNAMRGLRKVKKDQDVQDVETDEHDQADDDGADDGVW
ncbi:hypothetical protein FPRO06_05554 [Fusarium proliferatum]|nr:hypothetical protein FPRO03_08625 [Fusarium proliferatum]KAG4274199.1 hypothetical protein FPRO04_01840 [Fusarium proliferatum]KAG4287902.1 hypothetical protein FPRO06_05554 [Fusarium proliferatum]